MSIQVEDYFARDTFNKMKAFADKQETPFVLIDTAMISKAYDDLRAGFEFAKVYYAVKANPAVEIIDSRFSGFKFDLASVIADNGSSARFVGGGRARYVEDLDLRTLGVEQTNHCEPHAFGPTGDQDPLAGKLKVHHGAISSELIRPSRSVKTCLSGSGLPEKSPLTIAVTLS